MRTSIWRGVWMRLMLSMLAQILMLMMPSSYLPYHHVVAATACSAQLFVAVPLKHPFSAKYHKTNPSSIKHSRGIVVVALEFWKRAKGDHEIIDDNLSKEMNFSPSDDESYYNESPSPNREMIGSLLEDDIDYGIEPTNQSNTQDTNFSDVSIDLYNSSTSSKSNRWKHFSLLPGFGAFLPGKPLFMRFIPIRSIDGNEVELLVQEHITEQSVNSSDVSFLSSGHSTHQIWNISSPSPTHMTDTFGNISPHDTKRSKRRSFFQRNHQNISNDSVNELPQLSKEELECPFVATNIDELQTAVLIKKIPLRDVGFRFPIKGVESELIFGRSNDNPTNTFQRHDPIINGSLSSLLTYKAKTSSDPTVFANYQHGIELLSHHPVLSLVRERVLAKSKPGRRQQGSNSPSTDIPHLALVIEGGGMRGAVSAGMAAALSTLDLLDAFDSIHGSSAGSIVGAYLVSRQLCMDVYTDVMPAAGSKFVSKKGGMLNFGVDWLGDLIQRKLLTSDDDDQTESQGTDELCVDLSDAGGENTTSWVCEEDEESSVGLAMGTVKRKRSSASSPSARLRPDDQYGGILVESMNYLLSNAFHVAKSSISKPLSFGARRLGRAIRPAISALDVASSMRQYLRRRPGMNITYVLDGVMDEYHGLRPFDVDAFRANDKLQPLYMIASTVSNGGKGEMETGKHQRCCTMINDHLFSVSSTNYRKISEVAFNSRDGDFFGSFHEDEVDLPRQGERSGASWYGRMWSMLVLVPYTVFTAAFKICFARNKQELHQPMKDAIETKVLPSGTSAMYGFALRRRIRKLNRPQEETMYDPTGRINDEGKKGLFPCLEASMLVPGAAGPPIQLIRSKNRRFVEQRGRFARFRSKQELNRRKVSNSHLCFDAFCYEPIPYRSAVEKANATHVLVLRSRPDGCVVESRQHMYEKVVGPIYFRKHGMNQVAKLFSRGGSQYRYIEDILTLDSGLSQGITVGQDGPSNSADKNAQGVLTPPTKLFFGTDNADSFRGTDDWRRAHLLPITLPLGTPELPALCQDKDDVLMAVRNGYATAFDVLAPIAGLPFDSKTIAGEKVAKILFPDGDDDVAILNRRVKIKPSYIGEGDDDTKRRSFSAWVTRKREAKRKDKDEIASHPDGILARRVQLKSLSFHETDQYIRDGSNTLEYIETEALLAALPGFRGGRLDHIADNLLAERKRKNTSA